MLASGSATLRDFSIDGRRLALLSGLAVVVGLAGALLAKTLLLLIGAITHVAYTGHLSAGLVQPDPRHWGPAAILIPALGGLAVGLIAR